MSNGKGRNDKRSVRERAAAARAAQEAAERRRERTLRVVVALVVVLVVAGVGVGVWWQSRASEQAAADAPRPKGVTAVGGGIAYGPASGVPQLDLWEDFQCPGCAAFEAAAGEEVIALTDAGDVRVVYHPLSFLDASLGNDASVRATSAAGCAADQDRFREYHGAVFAAQPPEGTGYTNEQLVEFGRTAGITGAPFETFSACVGAQTYAGWAEQVQATMAQNQITSTPTLVLNGAKLDAAQYTVGQQYDAAALRAAITAAPPQG